MGTFNGAAVKTSTSMNRLIVLFGILAILASTGGLAAVTAPIVGASSGPVYPVMNTNQPPPDGVWFRNSPATGDTDKATGHGVYAGESVQLECYAWGQAVGPYSNRLWYFVLNVTRQSNAGVTNQGYLNAHYINDGANSNQVDAGVDQCGPSGPVTPPPPPPSPVPGPTAPPTPTPDPTPVSLPTPTPTIPSLTPTLASPITSPSTQAPPDSPTLGPPVATSPTPGPAQGPNSPQAPATPTVPTPIQTPLPTPANPQPVAPSQAPAPPIPSPTATNLSYDRNSAAAWAFHHAQDPQRASGLCTIFVSRALWAGGLPQTSEWQEGTSASKNLVPFLTYISHNTSHSLTDITGLLSTNTVPDAQNGDVILYSWTGETLDHAALVVDVKNGYPEVSEWGQFELEWLLHPSPKHPTRGWTYSAVAHTWLQTVHPRMRVYMLHIDRFTGSPS